MKKIREIMKEQGPSYLKEVSFHLIVRIDQNPYTINLLKYTKATLKTQGRLHRQ
jgi:hypothetical protein